MHTQSVDEAWVPFGRGARNCIGFVLAQMELTLIISRLAQRLDLAPATRDIPPPHGTREPPTIPGRLNMAVGALNVRAAA